MLLYAMTMNFFISQGAVCMACFINTAYICCDVFFNLIGDSRVFPFQELALPKMDTAVRNLKDFIQCLVPKNECGSIITMVSYGADRRI